MIKDYKTLGEFIEQRNERNADAKFGVNELRGVNSEGNICESRANVIGVEFNNYKICYKGDFIYNPARLDIGSISCLEEDLCIVSQMYVVFHVSERFKDVLLPEYLWLWFKHPEFFRYVGFINFGSVREMFTYEDMCKVLLPVPSISEQRRIVTEYQTVERRIRNNERLIEKLEQTAQAIYHHTFVEGIDEENLPEGWRMGCLGDFGIVVTGKTPSSDNPEDFGNDVQFLTPADFHNYTKYIIRTERNLSQIGYNRLENKYIPQESIIVTCIGSDMGKVAINSEGCISNQQINSIKLTKSFFKDYLFYNLLSRQKDLRAEAAGSSTMLMVNKEQFEKFEALIPDDKTMKVFANKIESINRYIKNLSREQQHLRTLQSLLTSLLA